MQTIEEKRAKAKEWYWKNREKCVVYTRNYRKTHPEIAKKYKETHPYKYTDDKRQHTLEWRKKNRQKARAQHLASRHVPLKDKCERCGSTESLMRHHTDYRKPLEVLTYCKKCHEEVPPIEEPKDLEPETRFLYGIYKCLVLVKGNIPNTDPRYWKVRVLSTGEEVIVYPSHVRVFEVGFGHARMVKQLLTK
jgi:hypothetical protein